jgi:hypothetical protein
MSTSAFVTAQRIMIDGTSLRAPEESPARRRHGCRDLATAAMDGQSGVSVRSSAADTTHSRVTRYVCDGLSQHRLCKCLGFMRGVRIAVAFLVLALSSADSGTTKPSAIATIPFEYHDGLLWASVSASGAGQPLEFLIDTGAASSVVDRQTAQRIG